MTKTDNTRPAGMLAGEQRDGRKHEGETFALTIDFTSYDHKPQGWEIAAITRRLQAAGPTELTIEEIALAKASGCTTVCATYDPNNKGWSGFRSIETHELDFDDDTEVLGKDGKPLKDETGHVIKRQLMPYERGYLNPWDALYRFHDTFGTWPLMMYPSLSYVFDGTIGGMYAKETKMKYRLMYDLGHVITDEAKASKKIAKMLRLFPEADQRCRNLNRLFFGASGKCVWFDRDGGAHYVRA